MMMPRIAFYAPLKAPDHPTPSGDRTMARLLIAAWRRQGAEIEIASRLRTRLSEADPLAQQRLARQGAATATRLIDSFRQRPAALRPQAWFTYHLYYKAPDWIGPTVAAALGIPYLLAEASHAPKRADGAWAFNHAGAEQAIRAAAAIFCLNPNDKECLAPLVAPDRLIDLPPFLDLAHFAPRVPDRASCRAELARQHGIDPAQAWLLAVGMMRAGDKLASYRQLAQALDLARDRDWQLLVVGDGASRDAVEAAFAPLRQRVHFLGRHPIEAMPAIYGAADLLVWPAVNEAFGMALLEAQSCAVPVLAGAVGGVRAIIRPGETGWLVPPDNPAAFAAQLADLLDRDRTMAMLAEAGRRARRNVETGHDIAAAGQVLGAAWQRLEQAA
ncbi:MAG: glycosyltransferase family 4 protein [Dongiaceae bacterium]